MIQFYFLSIVMNALAGYILVTAENNDYVEFKSGFSPKNETFKLVVGILSGVTGLLKILSVVEGDIPVVGDIIPAIIGILSSFVLIFEFYRNRSSVEASERAQKIEWLLSANKRIIGVAALIAAVLHFLFPKVLLL